MSRVTEAEAKQKMCCGPFGMSNHFQGQCVASKCMAWRGQIQWRPRSDYQWNDGKAESSGRNVEERIVGYCGLAGTP